MIDLNDLKFISERFGMPISGTPAPISIYKDGIFKGKEGINPHQTNFLYPDRKIVAVFHVKPIYYLHQNGQWRPMGEIASGFGNRWINLRKDWDKKCDLRYIRWLMKRMELIKGNVNYPFPTKLLPIREGQEIMFASPETFYPDPNVETTTVDGLVYHENLAGLAWADIRTATGNNAIDDTDANIFSGLRGDGNTDKWDRLLRAIFLFDTSPLPDTATISSAVLSLKGLGSVNPGGTSPSINIYVSNPAADTSLTGTDFATTGTTAFATAIAFASWSDAGYNDFTLNASGIANISKTIVSKFSAVNANYDVAGSAPAWSSGNQDTINGYYAETAGTTSDPKLVVTYTVPAVNRAGAILMSLLA